jgi:riboflavin synthase
MFTGIVAKTIAVTTLALNPAGYSRLSLEQNEFFHDVQLGASVAVNGVCLTVAEITPSYVRFDLLQQTLAVTNLGQLQSGQAVNVERAARVGDEIGGHLLSGHVDTVVHVAKVIPTQGRYELSFVTTPEWLRFILPQGYVALNGVSLTVVAVDLIAHSFTVHLIPHLIPETLARTNLGRVEIGDAVNLEVEQSTKTTILTLERMKSVDDRF